MEDYKSPIREELKKGIFKDYIIWRKISELEERIKMKEEGSGFIYKSVPRETSKTISPEEEYERLKALLPISEEDWEFRKWREELDFFNSIKKELLTNKAYRNKFVAIKDKKVIDYDIDKFRLIKRVNKKYRNEVVLIVKVERGVPVAEIPSPEVSL